MTSEEKNQDRAISKSEVQEGVQQALAMCATCSHTRGDHPGDSGCTVERRSKLMLMVAVDVVGKRFVAKDYSLRETRQLHVTQVFFMEPDSGRILDEHGNDVDPETGEILPGAS